MWEGEWREGQPWKVGTLTCPLSTNSQSQLAIWAAIGNCFLRADASIQSLSPNFVFQQTPAAAAAATLRGINFPLKTPGLPLSGESSMVAAEKQRSAFSSRPERRDVAALLMAGASQASLVDTSSSGSRNHPRQQQRRQHAPDADPIIPAKVPVQHAGSNPPSKMKCFFKGKSEEKFRVLAASSSTQIRTNSEGIAFMPSSKALHTLHAADTAQAQLRLFVHDADANLSATAGMQITSTAKISPAQTSKKISQRDINEAWV
jgi:hypothetical protein